jgi:hypothetical protein
VQPGHVEQSLTLLEALRHPIVVVSENAAPIFAAEESSRRDAMKAARSSAKASDPLGSASEATVPGSHVWSDHGMG